MSKVKDFTTSWSNMSEEAMAEQLQPMIGLETLILNQEDKFYDVHELSRAILPSCKQLKNLVLFAEFQRKDVDGIIQKILDMRMTQFYERTAFLLTGYYNSSHDKEEGSVKGKDYINYKKEHLVPEKFFSHPNYQLIDLEMEQFKKKVQMKLTYADKHDDTRCLDLHITTIFACNE